MKHVSSKPVVEDANTFIQFINIIGDISQTLYLASHPEESDNLLVQLQYQRDVNEHSDLYVPRPTRLQEVHA